MHDIKAIRENPDHYDKLWAKRGLEPQSKRILDQDKLIRKAMSVVQEAEAARNKASKQIGQAMAKGDKEEAEGKEGATSTHACMVSIPGVANALIGRGQGRGSVIIVIGRGGNLLSAGMGVMSVCLDCSSIWTQAR